MNGFSVIMPTYNQSAYIRRAIQSLFSQMYQQWELIIINDGCTDNTEIYIQDYLSDNRINYIKNERNRGLGFALNQGLDAAKYEHIAYLPSDDFYYTEHLQTLEEAFDESNDRILVYTTADSEIINSLQQITRKSTNGLFNEYSLQLVQAAHRRTKERWITRQELVSEDLFLLFWNKLVSQGKFFYINKKTSNWSIHSEQHHSILSEPHGGNLNRYRQYYNIDIPIRVKMSDYKFIDEIEMYKDFRKPPVYASDGLKILLVGELSYHPERIYALEEAGHRLYGLWMDRPTYTLFNVGHLPFGHVEDLSKNNWENEIRQIKPDIIYGMMNIGSIPIAYEVKMKCPDIPFVWHFKESPFTAQIFDLWKKLIELYRLADGKIYLNPECEEWFNLYFPPSTKGLTYILDGDLPKGNYFTKDYSQRLSINDNEIHTVVPGRSIGLELDGVEYLAKQRIHLHIYETNVTQYSFTSLAKKRAPGFVHYHAHCTQESWTKEFSKYDAGWLHCFDSKNNGNINLASWDDLNLPARMSVLAAAGIPMIQKNNTGHIVAMQSQLAQIDGGVFFNDYQDLADQLHNMKRMEELRKNVINSSLMFSFDYHVESLIDFFRQVIEYKHSSK
jgi:glycosyltransferase involved in cell wall biosynthesis